MKFKDLTVRKIKKVVEEKETEDTTKYVVELSNDDTKIVITSDEVIRCTLKDSFDVNFKNPQKSLVEEEDDDKNA